MNAKAWIELSARERRLLFDALSELRLTRPGQNRAIDRVSAKLMHAKPYPQITVGVHGGQVQWTLGNPFPIRVCDYDAESDLDLPDVDERGQRCRTWWEPARRNAAS